MIRIITADDYEEIYSLWKRTPGIGLRTLDDSREGTVRFLNRNPNTSFLYEENKKIAGVILAGHDGRRGYIYHACVEDDCRRRQIGTQLVNKVTGALKAEGIHKAALVVFQYNRTGNAFWMKQGFVKREDLCYYDSSLNDKNL